MDPAALLERYDYQTVVALKARLRQREAHLWAILRAHGPLRIPRDLVESYDSRDVIVTRLQTSTNEWILDVRGGPHGR